MAKKRPGGARNEMIHCEFCGEDYAATYKRCPFCDGRPLEEGEGAEEGGRRGGGRRLATNTRGGGYGGGNSPLRMVGTVISLALIVAAVCIVISLIMPLVNKGHTSTIDPNATPSPSQAVEPSQAQPSESPEPSADPSASPSPTVPEGQTATGFTLSQTEFTINDKYPNPVTISVTFIPEGSTGTITWSSSDPDVATVDENGKVTHGTKQGSATITATMGDGTTQECLVRNSVSSAASGSSGTDTGQTGGTLSLNKTDFSFITKSDPAVQMKVNGTSSTPTWSIGNTSVATISADGVVRPVGSGTTTITCKVDGQTLTCIVRCQF